MPTQEEMEKLRQEREEREEQMEKWRQEWKKEKEERQKEYDEIIRKEWEKKGVQPIKREPPPPKQYDHPNTMENSTATVLWLAVMLVGSIFKGNWVIWIIATIIWWKHITRHNKTK